jgi:hypothetical protein
MSEPLRSGLAPGDDVILQIDDDALRGKRVTVDEVHVHDGKEFITVLNPRADDDDWVDRDPWLTISVDEVRPVRAS